MNFLLNVKETDMNTCDITITFRFDDDELTREVIACLGGEQEEAACEVITLPTGASFDDIVHPFPFVECEEREHGTDVIVAFSSEQDGELTALILDLVRTAARRKQYELFYQE